MTPLRVHMIQQMQLHRLAPATQKAYVRAITECSMVHRRRNWYT
jgi:hypothetical protein